MISIHFSLKIKIPLLKTRKQKVSLKTRTDPARHQLSLFDHVGRLSGKVSPKTTQNYLTALRSFSLFLGHPQSYLCDITPKNITDYQQWLSIKGVCCNTSSCYMRSLRAIYNKVSTKSGRRKANPFAGIFTGNAPTIRRGISVKTIRRIAALNLPAGSSLCRARDMFLFSVYTMGMPFADIVRLTKAQVSNNMIVYLRKKTLRQVRISIEKCMTDIINRYHQEDSPLLFPFLQKGAEGLKQYQSLLSTQNKLLKTIGKLAKAELPLSTYVARHSWATIAYQEKVDLTVISEALGHANTKTTQIYIGKIDNNLLKKENRKVLSKLNAAPIHKRRFEMYNQQCTSKLYYNNTT